MRTGLRWALFVSAFVLFARPGFAQNCPAGYKCLPATQCSGAPDATGGTLTVTCPVDKTCYNGKCYPRDCPCPSGMCNPDFTCVDLCTAKGTPCGLGTTCDGTGKCIPDPICAGMSCPPGRICDKGACVMPNAAACLGVLCDGSMTCIDGRCNDYCQGVLCAPGTKCQGGCCVNDPACANLKCAVGTWCFNGVCSVPVVCKNVTCPKGQICDYKGGCIADSRCATVRCGLGKVCDKGRCVLR